MNDPHVESLVYELELGEGLAFNYPPPLDHETEHFALRLDSGTLTVSMKELHPSTRSARERVEPFLHSWELDNDLRYGPGTLRFAYQKSVVVDRNPPSSGTHRSSELEGMVMATTFGSVRGTYSRATYPAPPSSFVASPDVVTLWNRFQGYREKRELLSAMAYFCLTLLETRSGGRDGAAAMYEVHPEVLRKLGKLTSARGDQATGRKFLAEAQPLQPQEEQWVEDVVRALIRRVGEHAADAPLKKLSMADFPPLP